MSTDPAAPTTARTTSAYAGHVLGSSRMRRPASRPAGAMNWSQSMMSLGGWHRRRIGVTVDLPEPGAPSTKASMAATLTSPSRTRGRARFDAAAPRHRRRDGSRRVSRVAASPQS